MPAVRVGDLLRDRRYGLALESLAGAAGLDAEITERKAQKTGLGLTGLVEPARTGRVQVLGRNETEFLVRLPSGERTARLGLVLDRGVPCLIITTGLEPPPELTGLCERRSVALLRTPLRSSVFITGLNSLLEELMAEEVTLHGVLMDVLGVGVLLEGDSGVGKSECALDLVMRGHALVADDVVVVRRMPTGVLAGAASPVIGWHMEIRGLGILDIRALFGITAVRERKEIELALELEEWGRRPDYDRLGIEPAFREVLGERVPRLTVPVSQGRNLASIVEVAARNHILRRGGVDSALLLKARIDQLVRR